jgi:hypothetical protein
VQQWLTRHPNDRRRRDVIALEGGSPAAASRSAQMPGSSSSLQSHGDGSGCPKSKPVATIDGIAARQDGRVSNRCSGSRTDATRPRSGQPDCIIVWLPVRVLPAPPRSPAQSWFPGALGIVANFPWLCRSTRHAVARCLGGHWPTLDLFQIRLTAEMTTDAGCGVDPLGDIQSQLNGRLMVVEVGSRFPRPCRFHVRGLQLRKTSL